MLSLMMAILVCLFLCNIIGPHTAVSQPVITASPQDIDVSLSDALEVNCTVSVAGWSNVAALISLTVSRNNSQTGWTELAIITDFSHGQVNVMTTENVTANGWFKASGSASISLHWDYPADQQAGNYICLAEGLNAFGHSLVSHTAVQVSVQSPGLSGIQNKLTEINMQIKTLYEQLKQSQAKTEKLEHEVSELKEEKQSQISQMFEASFEYKNHTYYVSRDGIYDFHVSMAICRIYGGYLAEIDDSDEHQAINTFLNLTSGFGWIYISGTDRGHEETWTLYSGEPLTYEDWAPNEPKNKTDQDCMYLWKVQGSWMMSDYHCHYDDLTRDGVPSY